MPVLCPVVERHNAFRHRQREDGADFETTILNVYGTTFKALIHEEFGDGIMSAIDFNMDLQREPDPKGDRVRIVMSGKFLPYKTY